jgi:hypothetical protein
VCLMFVLGNVLSVVLIDPLNVFKLGLSICLCG